MPSWVHWILRNHFRSALKYWSNDKVWIYLKISSVLQDFPQEKSCEFISFKSWIDKTLFIKPSSGNFTSILYLNWINFMLTLQGNIHEDQVFKLMLWNIRMDRCHRHWHVGSGYSSFINMGSMFVINQNYRASGLDKEYRRVRCLRGLTFVWWLNGDKRANNCDCHLTWILSDCWLLMTSYAYG